MKFTGIVSLALCAAVASAADLNVGSVISSFYPTKTPDIPAAASTSLASALFSVQKKWTESPEYTSANSALYSAVPTSLQSSLSNYDYKYITAQTWYSKVPKKVQTAIAGEVSSIDSAAAKIVGTATSTGAAPRETGMAVAGLVGIAGLLAAL